MTELLAIAAVTWGGLVLFATAICAAAARKTPTSFPGRIDATNPATTTEYVAGQQSENEGVSMK